MNSFKFLTAFGLFIVFALVSESCHKDAFQSDHNQKTPVATQSPSTPPNTTTVDANKKTLGATQVGTVASYSRISVAGGMIRQPKLKASGNQSSTLYYMPSGLPKSHRTQEIETPPGLTPGTLTATEINDFAKWELWDDIKKEELGAYQATWHMAPEYRFSVLIKSTDNRPLANADVNLVDKSGKSIWMAKSDNLGRAELWSGMFEENESPDHIEVVYNGSKIKGSSLVPFSEGTNVLTVKAACDVPNELDLLFMVDATGSMSDEINHLKTELTDIVNRVTEENERLKINLGSIFYRCEGNEYTTRSSSFSTDIAKTVGFIAKQSAGEGGDEAVEIALEKAVNEFEWSDKANARILVMVLDEAPAAGTYKKLESSIRDAARKGIRIVPIVSSGVTYYNDKSLEYLMRSFALATNGTSAFLTDHSGVGNAHTAPTTDAYNVEHLNKLLVRVITQFSFIPGCEENYEDEMKSLSDSTVLEVIDHVVVDPDNIVHIEPDLTEDSLLTPPNIEPVDSIQQEVDEDHAELPVDSVENEVKRFLYYPNPTSGVISIETNLESPEIFIFDGNGKILERKVISSEIITKVDLGQYANGIYYLGYLQKEKWHKSKILLIH